MTGKVGAEVASPTPTDHFRTPKHQRMKKIVGLFDHDGLSRRQDLLPQDSARRISGPYKVDLLMDLGYDLVTVPIARTRLHQKLRDVAEHRTGIPLDLALRAIPHAMRADGVLAMLESRAITPSWFKRHHLPPYARPTLGALSCWWAEELKDGPKRRREIAKVAAGLDRLSVLSENQVELFVDAGVSPDAIVPVPYGVDETYFHPGLTTNERFEVYSAGYDRGRDYETMMRAAAMLPGVRFDVFTHAGWNLASVPANVTMHPPCSLEEHRHHVANARLVVVPTKDLAYPTGQSVLLESFSSGRPTIVTETRAMSYYVTPGVTAEVVPVGDACALADTIADVLGDERHARDLGRNGRQSVLAGFTYRHMWQSIGASLVGQP